MTRCFLGVDVGSVSTNLVATDEEGRILHKIYLKTEGQPISCARWALRGKRSFAARRRRGATGGAGGTLLGADLIKQLPPTRGGTPACPTCAASSRSADGSSSY